MKYYAKCVNIEIYSCFICIYARTLIDMHVFENYASFYLCVEVALDSVKFLLGQVENLSFWHILQGWKLDNH